MRPPPPLPSPKPAPSSPPPPPPSRPLTPPLRRSLVSFFREVPVVLARLRPYLATAAAARADAIEQGLRLRECQETLVSLTILAKKYKDLFWRVQKAAAAPQPQALQAGWLTFLLLKAQLLQQYPDLVSSLQLLVCVLSCYVANMPHGEAELRALMEQNPAAIDAGGRLDTLKLLAQAARADYAQVQVCGFWGGCYFCLPLFFRSACGGGGLLPQHQPADLISNSRLCPPPLPPLRQALMPTVEQHLRTLLQAGQFSWLPAEGATDAPSPHPLLAPACALRVPGMLSERRQLSELVLYLDSSYQAEYERAGEIDEREFLTTDFGALASPRAMLGASAAAAAAAGSGGSVAAPPHATPSSAGFAGGGGSTPGSAAAAAAAHAAANGLSPVPAGLAAAGMTAKPPLAPPPGLRRPLALGLQSPLPIMHLGPPAPATPITQAMGSVAWLHGVTKDAAAEPSAALRQLLVSAGPDAGAVLLARVQEAADTVFGPPQQPFAAAAVAADGALNCDGDGAAAAPPPPAAAAAAPPGTPTAPPLGGSSWPLPQQASLHASVARERREAGLKLYWHALESILRAEEARSGPAGATALATRWSFHCCLLALSFEMVAASYRMGALCFPAVPERLGLAPFDLTKIIPTFVRALPTMPRELKRHLFTVEEKVVEGLGWQASSSLYGVLAAAVGSERQDDALQRQQRNGSTDAVERQRPRAAADTGADAGASEQPPAAADAAAPMEADSGSASASGALQAAAPSSSWSPSTGPAASAAPARTSSLDEPSSKRRRGEGGAVVPAGSGGEAAGGGGEVAAGGKEAAEAEGQLPHALGSPPDAPAASGAAATAPPPPPAGSDPAARAVMFDFCRKVLKLAAFRLVAIRCVSRCMPAGVLCHS